MMVKKLELIENFRDLNLAVEVRPKSLYLGTLKITNDFLTTLREAQEKDEFLLERLTPRESGEEVEFKRNAERIICCTISWVSVFVRCVGTEVKIGNVEELEAPTELETPIEA